MKEYLFNKANALICFSKRFVSEYLDNSINQSSAQLSYYFLFSLFPFLMAFSALAVLNANEATYFVELVPDVINDMIADFLHHVNTQNNAAFFSSGLLLFLYAMARYINCTKRKLREIFNTKREHGIYVEWSLSLIYSIFLFTGLVLTFGLQAVGGEIVAYFSDHLFFIPSVFIILWPILRFGLIGVYVFLLLFFLYKTIPNEKRKNTDISKGAVFSTISWIVISVAFSFYIDNISNYSAVYGSISAFIVLMLWLFIVNNIILSGAIVTKILSYDV